MWKNFFIWVSNQKQQLLPTPGLDTAHNSLNDKIISMDSIFSRLQLCDDSFNMGCDEIAKVVLIQGVFQSTLTILE